jgi:GNAT superfamily N-acetyltransferase
MMKTLPTQFQLISPANQPDYRELVGDLADDCWPGFMLHDPVADAHWDDLFERFSDYQFGLLDRETGCAPVMANAIPLRWEGDLRQLPDGGWDWAFAQAVEDDRRGRRPNLQCALQVAIHPDYRQRGLSAYMIAAMRQIAASKGFPYLVAPLRPNQKALYPLTPMANYIGWQTADGRPFDAWLRVHARLGGEIIKVCERSMVIRGSREEWAAWTGLSFPESGAYIVPGALHPVDFDLKRDEGVYVEANVWVAHRLE